jgi:predicted porin
VPIAARRAPHEIDADTTAYYLEARYKLTSKLFGALRWNQQFFGEVPDGRGDEHTWDRDAWRADTALGYRLNRHLQAKLQYAFLRQTGRLQQGQQLVAAQVTLKF